MRLNLLEDALPAKPELILADMTEVKKLLEVGKSLRGRAILDAHRTGTSCVDIVLDSNFVIDGEPLTVPGQIRVVATKPKAFLPQRRVVWRGLEPLQTSLIFLEGRSSLLDPLIEPSPNDKTNKSHEYANPDHDFQVSPLNSPENGCDQERQTEIAKPFIGMGSLGLAVDASGPLDFHKSWPSSSTALVRTGVTGTMDALGDGGTSDGIAGGSTCGRTRGVGETGRGADTCGDRSTSRVIRIGTTILTPHFAQFVHRPACSSPAINFLPQTPHENSIMSGRSYQFLSIFRSNSIMMKSPASVIIRRRSTSH